MSSKVRCISCERRFSSYQALEHHLNHPSTSCRPWMDDVVKVSELIRNAHQSQLQHAPPLQDMDIPMQDQEEFLNDDWELNGGGPIDELELDPPRIHLVPHADSDINQRRDCYPTAARVYGKGHMFMDVFDADRFADKRKENLYYPFASKQD
jgi:hypothetical protein